MFNDNLTTNCFVHLYCFFIVNTKIFKVHVIIKIKRDTKVQGKYILSPLYIYI